MDKGQSRRPQLRAYLAGDMRDLIKTEINGEHVWLSLSCGDEGCLPLQSVMLRDSPIETILSALAVLHEEMVKHCRSVHGEVY